MNEESTQRDDPLQALVVRCLLIPISGATLMLPNTAVAEVADYQVPHPLTNAPGWLAGTVVWRGRTIPLVAFEQFLGKTPGVGGVHARAVVCNTLSSNRELPFIAILAQGIPRSQEVKGEMLEPVETDGEEVAAVAAWVRVDGQQDAVIPDLDVIERQLVQLGVATR